MHSMSSRWRKPKGRPSKKRKIAAENASKRLQSDAVPTSKQQNKAIATDKFEVSAFEETEKASSFTNNPEQLMSVSEVTTAETLKCDPAPSYYIVDRTAVSNVFINVPCTECNTKNLKITSNNCQGYATKMELICAACGHILGSSYSSQRVESSRRFDVNNKLVSAFLAFGKGHAALEIFSMVLGIPSMDSKTFRKCLDALVESNKTVKADMFKISHEAVRKVHMDADPSIQACDIINICVSYDGTWQKRGHTSLYGIGIVIETITGLVIDFVTLSKYCHECVACAHDLGEHTADYSIWKEGHQSNCEKNFDGSSNSMEMKAALVLWGRSVEQHGFRYTTVLSDGDAKTHQSLNENEVYGSGITIEKEECLNHVAKRLGTGLRNKIKEWRAKGITLGGRKQGSLKEDTTVKLQNYYRKAIHDNAPCVDTMKKGIFATLFHCMLTDLKPQHNKCPEGINSWCFYQRALASGEAPAKHASMKTHLSEITVEKILPVYQLLASNDLLLRCTSAKTQNANESLHSCIWSKCPKEVFVSKRRLDLAVTTAVSHFNIGCSASLQLSAENSNLQYADSPSLIIAKKRDQRRAAQRKLRSSEVYRQKKMSKRLKNSLLDKRKQKKEGVTYSAGAF